MTPRILLVCFVLCGCYKTTSPEPSPELEAYRGEQRIALFRECMAAAAKMARKRLNLKAVLATCVYRIGAVPLRFRTIRAASVTQPSAPEGG